MLVKLIFRYKLFQVGQALLQAANIACCHKRLGSQNALLTGGFAGQQVVFERFVAFYFAGTCNFEAVFQAAVRFHLRHVMILLKEWVR
jgi:uncharacterized membrane-anchored protein YitT (DUF2179 family)